VFSARLREEVDLDTLTGEPLAVVDQTMRPTKASLLLRPQPPYDRLAPPWPGNEPEGRNPAPIPWPADRPIVLRPRVMRYHPAWQPGQAEIAAAGGADRRSAKNAAAPMDQSREAHPCGAAAPLPRGGHELAGAFQVGTKLKDCHQGKRPASSGNFKPLSCTFAPPAGLEPAPYGLEVDPRLSMPSSLVLSALPGQVHRPAAAVCHVAWCAAE
jgi:hypothetical protein